MFAPASRQISTRRFASATSLEPHALKNSLPPPNVPVPNVSAGTIRPDAPSCLYSKCVLLVNGLRGAYARAHRRLERRRIFRIRIVASETDAVGCCRHDLGAGRAGDGGALFGDDARPRGLFFDDVRLHELAMAALGELVERKLLMVALCADDAREAAFLAEEQPAVEHPLHEALGEAEHRQRQADALSILEVTGIDRLVRVLGRIRHDGLQLVRPDGDDHAIEGL